MRKDIKIIAGILSGIVCFLLQSASWLEYLYAGLVSKIGIDTTFFTGLFVLYVLTSINTGFSVAIMNKRLIILAIAIDIFAAFVPHMLWPFLR